jgi:hypothetical protein
MTADAGAIEPDILATVRAASLEESARLDATDA